MRHYCKQLSSIRNCFLQQVTGSTHWATGDPFCTSMGGHSSAWLHWQSSTRILQESRATMMEILLFSQARPVFQWNWWNTDTYTQKGLRTAKHTCARCRSMPNSLSDQLLETSVNRQISVKGGVLSSDALHSREDPGAKNGFVQKIKQNSEEGASLFMLGVSLQVLEKRPIIMEMNKGFNWHRKPEIRAVFQGADREWTNSEGRIGLLG